MVNFLKDVSNDKSCFSSEGRQRVLRVIDRVVVGEIWLHLGWLDVKGKRTCRHSWNLVRLDRFLKLIEELDERIKDRIASDGSLEFFISERAKNEMINRNLLGVKKNRENYFGQEEDEGEVVRFTLAIDFFEPWTIKELIKNLERLEKLGTGN